MFKITENKLADQANVQTQQEYRIVNGCIVTQGGSGGTGTYTGTNGIIVNNTNKTIKLDNEGTTSPVISNLEVEGDLSVKSGANVDFSLANDVDLGKGCSVSSTGTSTTALPTYITINGVEYNLTQTSTNLYEHTIHLASYGGTDTTDLYFKFINHDSTDYDSTTLGTALTSWVGSGNLYITSCNGYKYSSSSIIEIYNISLNIDPEGHTYGDYDLVFTGWEPNTLAITSIGINFTDLSSASGWFTYDQVKQL